MNAAFFQGKTACCFSGHRPDSMPPEGSAGETRLKYALMQAVLAAAESGVTDFYNGGARGFDLLCGEAVLAVRENGHPDLRLFLFLPSPHHTDSWPVREKLRFDRLSEKAEQTSYAAPQNYPYAYLARNRALVDHSDCCICYLKKMSGGTLYTVNYAFDRGIPVLNLYSPEEHK